MDDGAVQRDSIRRSGHTLQRRRDVTSQSSQGSALTNVAGDEPQQQFIGGFAPMVFEQQNIGTPPFPDAQPTPSPPATDPVSSQHHRQPSTVTPPEPPQPEPPAESNVVPVTSPVPASVTRYSLVDKPVVSSLPVVVEPSRPEPPIEQLSETSSQPSDSPPIENAPAVADSLAALKKSDVLERRASKRFSTYNISKITNSGVRGGGGPLRGHSNRRSFAASSALTPGELTVLTEVDDEEAAAAEELGGFSRSLTRSVTPPVPSLPPTAPSPDLTPVVESVPKPTPGIPPGKIPVFLQLGREVKKAVVEPGLSFSSLRMLFVDRFAYNPGLENFPAIYIRDPSSGVQYELEDVDEVKEKCLLSLNIERELEVINLDLNLKWLCSS